MKLKKSRLARALSCGIVFTAAAACGTAAQADPPQYSFALITHAQPGDTFWDIVRKGAQAAAKKDNVRLIYDGSPTASGETQLITNVVQQHVDGLAVTLAFPDAEASAVAQAVQAGIPVVGFNAGTDVWKKQGLLMYVGQDESIAGQAVGEKLNQLGSKSAVCLDQQQGATQLQQRCDGIAKTFKGKLAILYTNGYDMASLQSRLVAQLQQNPDIDYVVTLGAPFAPTAVQAVTMAGSKAKVGTFDLTPQVVHLIQSGKVQWAVDQQPFVEGYESIDLLWLYKTNGDIVGGGGPVLTGPTFVTSDNIAQVAKFADQGTR